MRLRDAERDLRALQKSRSECTPLDVFMIQLFGGLPMTDMVDAFIVVKTYEQAKRRQRRRIARKAARVRWGRRS